MFSALLRGAVWGTTAGLPAGDASPANLRFDLGARPFAGEAHDVSASWIDSRTGKAMGVASANTTVRLQTRSARLFGESPNVPSICGTVHWGTTYNNRTEKYRPDWSWSGADATISQEINESQNLGVGFDLGGTWSQSGTAGLTANSGAFGSVANSSDNWILNAVNYRDETIECVEGIYRTPISMWALFSGFAYAGHPTYTACNHYISGSYGRSSGTASTYGAAIGIGPISVTAQSGYSSASKISWVVTSASYICGNGAGWASSGSVETHNG